jgi:hypothetical protein
VVAGAGRCDGGGAEAAATTSTFPRAEAALAFCRAEEAKAAEKEALLERLGITAEEAKLLLG